MLISGDTVKDENLIKAAKNVDVLIHEVIQRDLVDIFVQALRDNGQGNLGKIIHDTHDYHASPVEAAQAANEASADLLVYYHYAPVPQNAIMDQIFMRGVDDIRPTACWRRATARIFACPPIVILFPSINSRFFRLRRARAWASFPS